MAPPTVKLESADARVSQILPDGRLVRVHTHRITMDADVVRKRFVSWSDGEADREWAGLTALARHVPGLAPAPISKEIEEGAPVVVMSRVPGAPLGTTRLTPAQVHALAAALRRLFSVPVEPEVEERAFGPSVMRSFVREWAAESYDLHECRDPVLVGKALDLTRHWLASDDPTLDRVTDAVLARGDGNVENVMWDGSACRLIDFEEFGTSDIAYELADIVEHASSRLRGFLDVESLLDGMPLDAGQRSRLAAFRRLMAAFWLVMLLPGNGGFGRNPAGSTEDQARHVIALLRR
jgi:aminoglycoside phosphotransferase